MHFSISTTWGPTDPTRASLPFIFAASALEAGDSVTIMLFHDAVTIAVKGSYEKMLPVGPPPRFAEVLSHADAEIIVCKPCAEARGITEEVLLAHTRLGGMNDFHARASRGDSRIVCF